MPNAPINARRDMEARFAGLLLILCAAAAVLMPALGCAVVAGAAAGAGAGYVAGHEAGEDASGTQDP